MNLGTYQYPLPLLQMTKVGRHLQDIDEGARSGHIADIQAEGGDTHIMLSEERCPNSQVFPAKLRRLAAEELMENADSYATHPFLTAACAEMSCDMPTLMQTLISETNRHSVCVTDVAAAINEEG